MLLLTRNPGERIYIGEDAEIQICYLYQTGRQICLAIKAAQELPIYREEVWNREHPPLTKYLPSKNGGLTDLVK